MSGHEFQEAGRPSTRSRLFPFSVRIQVTLSPVRCGVWWQVTRGLPSTRLETGSPWTAAADSAKGVHTSATEEEDWEILRWMENFSTKKKKKDSSVARKLLKIFSLSEYFRFDQMEDFPVGEYLKDS